MKTLYLCDVPEEVAAGLAVLAERAGMSVSAFAVQELTQSVRRARNRTLLDSLPNEVIAPEVVVEAIDAGRRG